MSKINVNNGYIAKVTAAEVKNKLILLNNVNRDYDGIFEAQVNQYKVGETIKLAKPAIVLAIDGVVEGTDISGKYKEVEEEYVDAVVNLNPIIATKITDKDAIHKLDKPGMKLFASRVAPAISSQMADQAEVKAFNIFTQTADQVEVAETIPATGLKSVFKALNARLSAVRAPTEDRIAIVNTDVSNILTDEVASLFQASDEIATAYKQALMGAYGGMKFLKSELVSTRTNGCGGETLTLAADYVEGSTSIVLVDASDCLVGDKIEFGFNLVDQASKSLSTKKARRAITAITGNTITVSPIYFIGNALQNVNASGLATAATVTGLGTKGASYACFPVYQKKAFYFSPIKLPRLGALDALNASVDIAGVSVRSFAGDSVDTGDSKIRSELMGSLGMIRPEWAGVVEVNITAL